MESNTEKLLVVDSDDALRNRIATILSDAGYQVSTDYDEGMKSILAFGPDAVILGADPPQLDCCDLLSEIKGAAHTHNIRVVFLSPGGSAERTRGWISEPTMCCHRLSTLTNCCRGCVRN